MDFFSFNYKPKDFKGKSAKDILALKPNKVGDDFFTKYAAEIKEGDQALSEDELSAVRLLSDLKDKTKILEKCYKGKNSVVPGHHSVKKHPHALAGPHALAAPAAPAAPAAAQPTEEEVLEEDERELVPAQTGGRRTRRWRIKRSKRSSKKGSKKVSKRRRTRMRSSTRHRHTGSRRTGSKKKKRVYHGGFDPSKLSTGPSTANPIPPISFKL